MDIMRTPLQEFVIGKFIFILNYKVVNKLIVKYVLVLQKMFVMNVMQDFKYILMLALELVLLVNYNTIIIKLKTPIKPLQVYENALHVIQIVKNVSLLQQTVLNVMGHIFFIIISVM